MSAFNTENVELPLNLARSSKKESIIEVSDEKDDEKDDEKTNNIDYPNAILFSSVCQLISICLLPNI